MTRLPELSYRQVKRALESAGYVEHAARGKGGHRAFLKPDDPTRRPLTVPYHKTVSKGTLREIIKQAGLTVEQFLALL